MSNAFHVDTERISAASADIRQISGNVEAEVAAMMSRLNGLQDAWTGEASARFQAVAAEWKATQLRVRESLDHIGALLQRAGTQYAEAEQANAAMFR